MREYSSNFHSQCANEEDGLEDAEVHIDLGDDPDQNCDAALSRMIANA